MREILGQALVLQFLMVSLLSAQPLIEDMSMDEAKSQLIIKGKLGPQGSVTIDGETATFDSWTDTLMIVNLPRTGKGSAGPVVLVNSSGTSETRLLSLLQLDFESYTHHEMACGASDASGAQWLLTFRIPFETMLLRGEFVESRVPGNTGVMSGAFEHIAPFDPSCAKGDKDRRVEDRDSGFAFYANVSSMSREFYASVPEPEIPSTGMDLGYPYIVLDENFKITPGQKNGGFNGSYSGVVWKGSVDFPVRLIILEARKPLTIVAPSHGSALTPSNTIFEWREQTWSSMYRFQLSKDGNFATLEKDTNLNGQSLLIDLSQASGQYFWRVQASNDSITGPWSSPRTFVIEPASVETSHSKSQVILTARAYDMLGRYVGLVDYRDPVLPRGVYFLVYHGNALELRSVR